MGRCRLEFYAIGNYNKQIEKKLNIRSKGDLVTIRVCALGKSGANFEGKLFLINLIRQLTNGLKTSR